tara:strand:- start:11071 stop:11568 length:498 start_codon:yes stop_codon:yes gene_type:complete
MLKTITTNISSINSEEFFVPTADRAYPLGTELQFEYGDGIRTANVIYGRAGATLAADQIYQIEKDSSVIPLPAAGGEKGAMPIVSTVAVTSGYYCFFIIKGQAILTADGSGVTSGQYIEWIKNTTTVKDVGSGIRTATCVGSALATAGAGATVWVDLDGQPADVA